MGTTSNNPDEAANIPLDYSSFDGKTKVNLIPLLSSLWSIASSNGGGGILEEHVNQALLSIGVPADKLDELRELIVGNGVLKISGDKYMITPQAYDAFTQMQPTY